jgi:hypothetical protein
MQNLDASFTAEVTRRDDPNIIALDRQKALFLGVRLAYDASGYAAGVVLGKNTTSGLWMKYSDAGSSGENTAVAVLEKPVAAASFVDTTPQSSANSVVVPAIFGGTVFYSKLTGIDANGITDLRGRRISDVTGADLLVFG